MKTLLGLSILLGVTILPLLNASSQQDALFGMQSAARLDVRSLLSVERAAAGASFEAAVALDIHPGCLCVRAGA